MTGRRLGLAAAVTALLVFSLFPVYWMVSSAVDPGANTRGAAVLPSGFTLDHFRYVLDTGDFTTYLANSALVAPARCCSPGCSPSSPPSPWSASGSGCAPKCSS